MNQTNIESLINNTLTNHLTDEQFEQVALEVFRFQFANNAIYQDWCTAIKRTPDTVYCLTDIPFLPISFFRTHQVVTRPAIVSSNTLVFESSGTTASDTSRHYVFDASLYEKSLLEGFKQYYGAPSDYVISALLPSYLERQNASLVYMANVLMRESDNLHNGFYINELQSLYNVLNEVQVKGKKILLLGVTFALLDFAEAYPMQMNNTIVMETGGMKGRRKELTRATIHDYLCSRWGLEHIHSEYGMTELLSQAYSLGGGIYKPTTSMRLLVRDINDPLDVRYKGQGVANVVDFANVYSCSFIATDDLCILQANKSFEILGRVDNSILRGCSLMTA